MLFSRSALRLELESPALPESLHGSRGDGAVPLAEWRQVLHKGRVLGGVGLRGHVLLLGGHRTQQIMKALRRPAGSMFILFEKPCPRII